MMLLSYGFQWGRRVLPWHYTSDLFTVRQACKPRHTHKSFSTDTNLLRNVTLYTNTYTNQQAICIYTKIPVIMVCARTRYWYLIWMIGTDPPSPNLQHIHNTAIRQYTTLQESRKNDSVGEQEARSDNKSLWREYTQWVSMGDSL